MSNATLIIGASGSGKSTSMRNLNSKETFCINVLDKPLPFRFYKKNYTRITGWDDKEGNYYASDDWMKVMRCIKMVNEDRPDIKTLILDDAHYLMAHEFMRRSSEHGFNKFTELATHIWSVFNAMIATREDLFSVVMTHNEIDMNGVSKLKTIGKLLDEKITLEGMFTSIFQSVITNGEFKFLTQSDGSHIAKNPLGMFEQLYIDNDLSVIREVMFNYYDEEE